MDRKGYSYSLLFILKNRLNMVTQRMHFLFQEESYINFFCNSTTHYDYSLGYIRC